MGAVLRLGRRGVALGAAIAMTFGLGAGVLATRWSQADAAVPDAAPAAQPSGVVPVARAAQARPAVEPVEEAVAPTPAQPPLERTCGTNGRVVAYAVKVGPGIATTVDAFARDVADVLCDPRGWIASGGVRFRYDPRASVRILLLSPQATERRCLAMIGLSVREKWSCASSAHGKAILNADRWFEGSPSWPGSVRRYRAMLVNHEVGHVLGHRHRGCGGAGERAPVMMQQSKGLSGCQANPWPTRAELRATR